MIVHDLGKILVEEDHYGTAFGFTATWADKYTDQRGHPYLDAPRGIGRTLGEAVDDLVRITDVRESKPPTPKGKQKVKTAFVIDRLGSAVPREQEIEEMLDGLRAYGLDIELVEVGETMLDVWRDSFDLLVLDYGGVGVRDQAHGLSMVRAACDWAENHPGSILLLWTPFTYMFYERDLIDSFGHIDNIWYRYATGYDFTEHAERDKELGEKLRLWLA